MRSNLTLQYLFLSSANGLVPFAIALLLSASGLVALLVWGIATTVSYFMISLCCSRCAMEKADQESEEKHAGVELERATIYH